MEEELRVGEKGARGNTREGNLASNHSRVPCDIKINSWTTQAKKMRGSMPPKIEVREILRKLDRAGLENMLLVWDNGRMIEEE